jgi:hypothetical protein
MCQTGGFAASSWSVRQVASFLDFVLLCELCVSSEHSERA